MELNKLISIAMCTYNGEKFIHHQIQSILDQSYSNIELIISDDCSTDNTIQIIQKYQKSDARIKLYKNKTNFGFKKNFETAISLCNGDFIALSDQDDIWKIDKLEKFLDNIQNNVLIYSDAILIDQNHKKTNQSLIEPTSCLVEGNNNKAFLLSNCVSGNTMMFKSELTPHILPIPQTISYHDIWISFVASTYGTITCYTEPMTYYRRHEEQVTHLSIVKYTSFLDKLQKKQIKHKLLAANIVNNMKAFLSLEILKNKETIELINLLKEHFSNYHNVYYDKKLYKKLQKYQNQIFAILPPSKRKKRIYRTSIGLKLRKITLFKL